MFNMFCAGACFTGMTLSAARGDSWLTIAGAALVAVNIGIALSRQKAKNHG